MWIKSPGDRPHAQSKNPVPSNTSETAAATDYIVFTQKGENLQGGEFKTGSFTRSPQGDIKKILLKPRKSKGAASKVVDENEEPLVVM